MSEKQLHLFEPVKPLVARFGDEFFRAVPAKPGVYIMGGDGERVLYIGQSKNLRHRLGSYKNARADRAPRKVIRLVHSVRTIVWEECETHKAARVRENQLLQIHRPKFNVMNTYPQAYRFIAIDVTETHLGMSAVSEPGGTGKIFGAFKGARHAFGAMSRLLWAAWRRPESVFDIPAQLLGERVKEFRLEMGSEGGKWTNMVHAFFSGESDELLVALGEVVPQGETISVFQRNLQANDLEIVSAFFERGPKRNRQFCVEQGREIVPQEELDNWLVMSERQ